MLKILIPITFSKGDTNCIEMAFLISRHLQCHITLLNCIPDIIDKGLVNETHSLFVMEQRRYLNKFVRYVQMRGSSLNSNTEVESRLEYGYPEDVIIKLSKEYNLIVMSSSCPEQDIKEITGSTTKDVVTKSKTPVIMIPSHYQRKEESPKILLSIEITGCDYKALHQVLSLMAEHGSVIHCVEFSKQKYTEREINALNELKNYMTQTYRGTTFIVNYVTSKNITQSLEEYIARNEIQLLTITKRDKNLLHRYSSMNLNDVMNHIRIPILVMGD